jgi:serine/threonine protein kinase
MVFESMHMNLRELLHRYGKIVGISIMAVKQYAKQMVVALKHLQACRIIHADLKLDNIVVNESKNSIRICDLGSAERWTSEPDITPYRQSRFYRAPEVTLGLHPGYEMDMWSAACCLFELYTGKILFQGCSNNQMIKLYMEVKGPFPKKLIRRAQFSADHFSDDCETFLYRTKDVVTGMDIIQKMKVLVRCHAGASSLHTFSLTLSVLFIISVLRHGLTAPLQAPSRPILKMLRDARHDDKDEEKEKKMATGSYFCIAIFIVFANVVVPLRPEFADFLNQMLVLDPQHRLSAGDALKHAFLCDS